MSRQCSSCGGICKRSGCERANVEVKSVVSEKTGGSVFPTIHNGSTLPGERGITLRDWFAGMAMQALLTALEDGKEHQAALIPGTAYRVADAMLKAKEVK